MNLQLRAFVERHPDGWNHEDWLGLLGELEGAGADVSAPEALGAQLERERLDWELDRRELKGLGPKRREALVDRFGSLWSLRQASVDDVAAIRSIPKDVAEEVVAALS